MKTFIKYFCLFFFSFYTFVNAQDAKEIMRKAALGLFGFSIIISVISAGSITNILFYLIQSGLLLFFLTRPKLIEVCK